MANIRAIVIVAIILAIIAEIILMRAISRVCTSLFDTSAFSHPSVVPQRVLLGGRKSDKNAQYKFDRPTSHSTLRRRRATAKLQRPMMEGTYSPGAKPTGKDERTEANAPTVASEDQLSET